MTEKELNARNAQARELCDKMAAAALPLMEEYDFATSQIALGRFFASVTIALANQRKVDIHESERLAIKDVEMLTSEVYIKESTLNEALAHNPATPFQEGDILTYMIHGTQPSDILVLDHIEPRSDKKYDIYCHLLWSGGEIHERDEGRMWHVGSGLRYATREELERLVRSMLK